MYVGCTDFSLLIHQRVGCGLQRNFIPFETKLPVKYNHALYVNKVEGSWGENVTFPVLPSARHVKSFNSASSLCQDREIKHEEQKQKGLINRTKRTREKQLFSRLITTCTICRNALSEMPNLTLGNMTTVKYLVTKSLILLLIVIWMVYCTGLPHIAIVPFVKCCVPSLPLAEKLEPQKRNCLYPPRLVSTSRGARDDWATLLILFVSFMHLRRGSMLTVLRGRSIGSSLVSKFTCTAPSWKVA